MDLHQLTAIIIIPEVFSMIVGYSEKNQDRKSGLRMVLYCFFIGWNL